MRAKYRETRQYSGVGTDAFDPAAAAAVCRFRVLEVTREYAHLRCGLSWWSFGEDIKLHLSEISGALVVDVTSACRSPTQIEDWGKNAKNVRRLFEALEQQAAATTVRQIPACPQCGYLLAGIDQRPCPECGRTFDWAAPVTRDTGVKWLHVLAFFAALTAGEILVLFVLGSLVGLPWPFQQSTTLVGIGSLVWPNAWLLLGYFIVKKVWRPNR